MKFWSGAVEGFFAPPFLGAECWSGAEHVFRSGVRKGVPSKNNGVYQSLVDTQSCERQEEEALDILKWAQRHFDFRTGVATRGE